MLLSLQAGQYISLRTLSSSRLGTAGTSDRQGSWWTSDLWIDLCWLYRAGPPLRGWGGEGLVLAGVPRIRAGQKVWYLLHLNPGTNTSEGAELPF